jgi:two-component system, LuxR family, sensor kinase FixL
MANDSDLNILFESVIQTAVDGIINIDNRGNILRMNHSAQKLFEYKEAEVLGKNVSMLMNNHDATRHDTYIHNYISTKIPTIIGIGREVVGKTKSGELFPFRLAVSEVILNDRIIFTGIIHDLRDIKKAYNDLENLNKELDQRVVDRTYEVEQVINQLLQTNKKLQNEIKERLETEQQLQETENELKIALSAEKELNELKSRFITTASHEFRTPLATILSSASLILKYPLSQDQENREKHVGKIKTAVNHLTGLLNDFLSLSKLEENKVNVVFEKIDFSSVLSNVKEELSGILKKDQKIITNHFEEFVLFTDKVTFKNILFNIISNAIKYSDKDILIDARINKSHCEIQIIDNGIGIPEEDQKHLFSRFFRASNVGNIQGTGLGLNIVKKYCELIHAEVKIKSIYGEGTSVFITVPN